MTTGGTMKAIVLYDLPSKGGNHCWSLNPWKTRLALNFKQIPYTTEWIEYPDIAPTFKSWGIPPNETGNAAYSIPTVRLPNDTLIMDSKKIAYELEKQTPSPPLHLDSEVLAQVEQIIPKIQAPMAPVLMPQVPRNLLNPPSAQYFEATRAVRFGMSLPELEKEKGGEQAWEAAKEPIMEVAALLKKQGGPFFLGSTPSYVDLVVLGFLHFTRRINENDFKRIVDHDPAFMKLYDASAKWLEPDH